MSQRRILTVCSSHRVFGAETITLRLLQELERRGHDQLAVTNRWTDGEFSRRLRDIGVAETVMPFGVLARKLSPQAMWWTFNMMVRVPQLWIAWRRTMRRFAPDIILWTGARQPLPLLPLLGTVPSFVIEYSNVPPTSGNRWLYEHVGRVCRGFVAVSDFMRDHLIAVGAPADRIHVIKSGAFFASDAASTAARFSHRPSNALRVGIAGQIASHKGHDVLVEALRLVRERGVPATVVAFGDGDASYIHHLQTAIDEAGLTDAWSWKGYERDKAALYQHMDVCAVPSRFGDPFPTVAMEAGAYGRPVIAARVGGLPEIVEDGTTGLVCEPDDAASLASAIEWIAHHPDEAARMGEAGHRRVFAEFTVERMADGFERLFARTLVNHEGRFA